MNSTPENCLWLSFDVIFTKAGCPVTVERGPLKPAAGPHQVTVAGLDNSIPLRRPSWPDRVPE